MSYFIKVFILIFALSIGSQKPAHSLYFDPGAGIFFVFATGALLTWVVYLNRSKSKVEKALQLQMEQAKLMLNAEDNPSSGSEHVLDILSRPNPYITSG